MKFFLITITVFCLYSCGNERVLQLPEIQNAKITEVHDVSAAYLFYDETQPDSVDLNRKNLISTTNWLVNVDKRLSLAQAIPKITFLQNKKRNAEMHKNEDAKNYYTCNDTSIQNLGFLEFTEVVYHLETIDDFLRKRSEISDTQLIMIQVDDLNHIQITDAIRNPILVDISHDNFIEKLQPILGATDSEIFLQFNGSLKFQDYITLKNDIENRAGMNSSINPNEFIY